MKKAPIAPKTNNLLTIFDFLDKYFPDLDALQI